MRRRNVEESHAFSSEIAQACGIYELGGLLLDAEDRFTAAVEAYEASPQEVEGQSLLQLLDRCGYYGNTCMACLLAQELDLPFYLFLRIDGQPVIHQYALQSVWSDGALSCACAGYVRMSEAEFLAWWRRHKQTVQTKEYRSQLRARAAGSYFDRLLEGAGMKWGGNIDGFLVSLQERPSVSAIIENRFTNKESIFSYDPARYYRSDVFTWHPLFLLRDALHVPLLLCTYSRRPREEHLVGLARVSDFPADPDKLSYVRHPMNRRGGIPGGCIVKTPEHVQKWLSMI